MGYIFISYSSKNQTVANKLCKMLKYRNIDYWIATEHISGGENYAKVIPSAIKNCSCAILLLSDASQQSIYVSNEIDRVINAKKPVFPIRVEDCQLTDEFDFYLCRCQIVDAYDMEEGTPSLSQIFESIHILTNKGKLLLELPPTKSITDIVEQTDTSAIVQVLANNGVPCTYTGRKFVGRLLVRYYFDTTAPFSKLKNLEKHSGEITLYAHCNPPEFSVDNVGGRIVICAEIARMDRQLVSFEEVFDITTVRQQGKLAFPLGVDFDNKIHFVDVAKDNSILVVGATATGKTQIMYNVITSLTMLCTPQQLKFIIFDSKWVEFTKFAKIPHLLKDIITNPQDFFETLNYLCNLVDGRHRKFHAVGKRNIDDYNQIADEKLENIVVIIDDLSDLFLADEKKAKKYLTKLAQRSRSAGVHILACAQRINFTDDTMMLNTIFPSRIVLRLPRSADSQKILNEYAASSLMSSGDLYYNSPVDNTLVRLQSPYLSSPLIDYHVESLK